MAHHDYHALYDLGDKILTTAITVVQDNLNSERGIEAQTIGHEREKAGGTGPAAPQSHGGVTPPSGAEIESYMRLEYGDIPALMGSYAGSDPSGAQAEIDALWSVAAALHPGLSAGIREHDGKLHNPVPTKAWMPNVTVQDRVRDTTNTYLANWDGDAANAFRTHFLNHIDTAAEMQSKLASSLAIILRADQEIHSRANDDAWKAGQKTLHALEQLHHCNPDAIATTISVVGAVAAVLAAVPTGGGSVAAAGLVLGGVVATAAADDASKPISADHVPDVLQNLRKALSAVASGSSKQEGELAKQVSKTAGAVGRIEGKGQLTIPAPADVTKLKHDGAGKLGNTDPSNEDGFYAD